MTDEPFLILHKVRGEPAFDIAIKIQIGAEEAWIIPTSGHRAYPYWTSPTPLDDILYTYGKFMPLEIAMPADWPDHYAINDRPTTVTTTQSVANLLTQLGFAQPINRRA